MKNKIKKFRDVVDGPDADVWGDMDVVKFADADLVSYNPGQNIFFVRLADGTVRRLVFRYGEWLVLGNGAMNLKMAGE